LQLVRAYAALANDGVLMPVSLLKVDQPPEGTRAVSPEIARHVLSLMEGVVESGTGSRAAIPGYRVAGKTGTSWMYSGDGKYDDQRHRAIFAGVVPASNPRLAAVVVIDEPRRSKLHGGDVAAPVFSAVMREALRTMAIPPDARPTLMAGVAQDDAQ
ncbi:MAG: penicillin-binding transpeptidase domain-containing protein, partial [Pseudomonadota bacterium]